MIGLSWEIQNNREMLLCWGRISLYIKFSTPQHALDVLGG